MYAADDGSAGCDGCAGEGSGGAAAEIARQAHVLRNEEGTGKAERYLLDAIRTARACGDRHAELVALEWLSTTLVFDGRRDEGVQHARHAREIASQLYGYRHIKCSLNLAGLLSRHGEDGNREAERILLALHEETTADGIDSRYEDMRLQRLESVYRASGRTSEARQVVAEIEALRACGKGFTDVELANPQQASGGRRE